MECQSKGIQLKKQIQKENDFKNEEAKQSDK